MKVKNILIVFLLSSVYSPIILGMEEIEETLKIPETKEITTPVPIPEFIISSIKNNTQYKLAIRAVPSQFSMQPTKKLFKIIYPFSSKRVRMKLSNTDFDIQEDKLNNSYKFIGEFEIKAQINKKIDSYWLTITIIKKIEENLIEVNLKIEKITQKKFTIIEEEEKEIEKTEKISLISSKAKVRVADIKTTQDGYHLDLVLQGVNFQDSILDYTVALGSKINK